MARIRMFDILLHMVEGDQSRRGRRYDSFRESERVDPYGPQPEEWLPGYPSGHGEPDTAGPQWADIRPATYQVPSGPNTQRDQPRAGEWPQADDQSDPGGWPSAGSQTGRHAAPVPGTRSMRKPQTSSFRTDDTSDRKPIITPISQLLGPETTAEPPSLTPIFPSMAPSPPPADPAPPPRGRSSVPTRQPHSSPPAARYSSPPAARYSSPPADQYSAPRPGRYTPPPAEQFGMPRAGQTALPPPEPYAPPVEQYGVPRAGRYSAPPAEQYGAPRPGEYRQPDPEQYQPAADPLAYPGQSRDAARQPDRPGNGYQTGAAARGYATPPTSGYPASSGNGYGPPPEAGNGRDFAGNGRDLDSGYAEPRAGGYTGTSPAAGYTQAPPAKGYAAPPSDAYAQPPTASGYAQAPPATNGYAAPPPSNGYAAPPPSNGYAAPPATNGYAAPPPSNGYAAPPATNSYAAPPAAGYAAVPGTAGYFDESGATRHPAAAERGWVEDGYRAVQPADPRTAQSARRAAPETLPRSAPPTAPRSPATAGGYQTPQMPDPRRSPTRGSRLKDAGTGRSNRWVAAMTAIAVVVVIAVIAVSAYFISKDDSPGAAPGPESGASTDVSGRDLSSRDVDPDPLTEAEVFPAEQVSPTANEAPYAVLKKQASDDCRTAAADELGTLLADSGCSQVIRATLKHPNGKYLVTTGLFNLADQASADRAHDGIKPTVDAQKGRFTVMPAGAGTEAIVRAPTQLGWNVRGHYLAYCVIARADGQPFAADDQFPQQIIFDLIETYLGDQVIGARAALPPPADPANPADPGNQVDPGNPVEPGNQVDPGNPVDPNLPTG